MVKYFECHSGSLMNQRQTPSQSYLALTVPHVGMCWMNINPGSGAPVSASLILRALGYTLGDSQQHHPHRPSCGGRAPTRAAHSVSGGPHTPSLIYSLGKGEKHWGRMWVPCSAPDQEGAKVCCCKEEGRAQRLRGAQCCFLTPRP